MENNKEAVFIRTSPGKIKIAGKIISEGQQVIGDYNALNGLPGIHFLGFKNDLIRASRQGVKTAVVEPSKKDDKTFDISVKDEPKEEKQIGFTLDRLKELKAIKPVEWVKQKKSLFIDILNEGNIDYSAVKDDRMALYKFLTGILKDL